jgi:hypothetical protein
MTESTVPAPTMNESTVALIAARAGFISMRPYSAPANATLISINAPQ